MHIVMCMGIYFTTFLRTAMARIYTGISKLGSTLYVRVLDMRVYDNFTVKYELWRFYKMSAALLGKGVTLFYVGPQTFCARLFLGIQKNPGAVDGSRVLLLFRMGVYVWVTLWLFL